MTVSIVLVITYASGYPGAPCAEKDLKNDRPESRFFSLPKYYYYLLHYKPLAAMASCI